MGKIPLPILKELEYQARQNISTLNFATTFAKTSSSCNSTLEKCQHSLKSIFKKVKSQIQKGADPEKAVKCGYEEACEYLYMWNKAILIQHRTLTCLSKSLAHILQRELYSMGNTGFLRCEVEMTLLQPQLGETRCQELRNVSFWPSSLFKSQSRKVRTSFLKRHLERFSGSPPFFQKRLASKQLFIQPVKDYHQCLRTAIPLKTKLGQISSDNIRIQGPSKRPSFGRLHPASSVKECY